MIDETDTHDDDESFDFPDELDEAALDEIWAQVAADSELEDDENDDESD